MPRTFRKRRTLDDSLAAKVPGVAALARLVQRLSEVRVGRAPVGLLALLPVAILLDLFDVADELALGPVGMALSFVLETAFVLGLTGRASYALGFAGIDLVPGVDVIPFATLTLVKAIADAWGEGRTDTRAPRGPSSTCRPAARAAQRPRETEAPSPSTSMRVQASATIRSKRDRPRRGPKAGSPSTSTT